MLALLRGLWGMSTHASLKRTRWLYGSPSSLQLGTAMAIGSGEHVTRGGGGVGGESEEEEEAEEELEAVQDRERKLKGMFDDC